MGFKRGLQIMALLPYRFKNCYLNTTLSNGQIHVFMKFCRPKFQFHKAL